MDTLGNLFDLRRDSAESFAKYRTRFGTVLLSLRNISSTLSQSMVFIRALKSLIVSAPRRASMLTVLCSHGKQHIPAHLEYSPIWLFGLYSDASDSAATKQTPHTGEG